jgi:hypothetical protein
LTLFPYTTLFRSRINTDGSFLWTFSTNDIYGFCASAENQFRITGEFAGSASFGDISLNATGGASNDVYLCKVQYGPDIPQSIAQNSVEFGVYPHPASDIIHIKTNYDISYVSIIDAEGREVLATKDKTISVHHLSPGMYFIKALSETGETFGKPLLKL